MPPVCTPALARLGRLVLATGAFALAVPTSALEVGTPAPAFTAPALDGSGNVSLARHRGKVVLLDFWASWCAPCLTSLPLLDGLRGEFPGADFQVLAVNVDREPERARRFLARLALGYPSAMDPEGRIPERFGLESMPTSFLIDRSGVIRYVHEGFRRGDIGPLRARIADLVAARN